MRGQPLLSVRSLSAGYSEQNIIHEVSLEIPHSGFVSVIGPNGAGKSTLLKALYGLIPPRGGSVVFRRDGSEHEVTGWKPHRLTAIGLNYVPQLANVFPNMTVFENLELGARAAGPGSRERIDEVVQMFPLLGDRRRTRAGTLSGGQRQMLALGRALATRPRLLLLDEPSAGLAATIVDELFERLVEINTRGTAILLVEQNARRSLATSDYGYVLDMGRNRYEGEGPALADDSKITDLYLGGSSRFVADRTNPPANGKPT